MTVSVQDSPISTLLTNQDSSSSLDLNIQYEPGQKQKEFHDHSEKYRLFLGAWRAGKTYSGCYEAFRHSIVYPGNFGLIGRKNFADLRDTTIKTFFEICPEELIRNYHKTEHRLTFTNGSQILFRELKDGEGLGSLNLGFFYIDEAEQVRENVFDRLQGRLSNTKTGRQCGWVSSNPPNKDHWIYKRFVEDKQEDYSITYASTYENAKYLPAGYISSIEKMPVSWQKKYLHGHFGFTPDGKPFYDGFNELLHKRQLNYIPGKVIYRGIDFGYHHPAVIYCQFDAQDRFMVIGEILGDDVTLDKFCRTRVIPFENTSFPQAKFETYYDPSGVAVTDKSEKTSVDILTDNGIIGSCKQSTYRERKELVEKQLSLLISGVPGLIVDESCKIVIDGFLGGYHYPESKGGKPVKEEPERDGYYEHLMNCLEYVFVNLFSVGKIADEEDSEDESQRRKLREYARK